MLVFFICTGTETGTDDDDCSDYNRITSEFRNCSVYLTRFTDMSDSDLDNWVCEEINVSRARDPVHVGDKALTRETPAKRGRINRYD
jgi:hypothetical protein